MFKNKHFFSVFFALITACSAPLYETDVALYHQYKYWQTATDNWIKVGSFDFFVQTSLSGTTRFIKMIPHRNGLPDFSGNYIKLSKQLGFQLMNASCGENNYDLLRSTPPTQGRSIDPFFYQYPDLSIGASFICRTPSAPTQTVQKIDDEDEANKWHYSKRERRSVDGTETYIDTLPPTAKGMHQFRIRMFNKDTDRNKRLAREIILKTCGSPMFTLNYAYPTAEYIKKAGMPAQKISDRNVYAYGFTCH